MVTDIKEYQKKHCRSRDPTIRCIGCEYNRFNECEIYESIDECIDDECMFLQGLLEE